MSRRSLISAAFTALAALLTVGFLLLVHLRFDPSVLPDPPRPTAGLLEEEPEEEYAELYTPEPEGDDRNPLPALNPEPAVNRTAPPAPVKPEPRPAAPEPVRTQTSRAEIEQREMRETADSETRNAFANPGNTNSPGTREGDSGKPDGTATAFNGNGTGTVGGGWTMPRYEKVKSEQTGSVILRAVVDRTGKVVKVEQIGGKAPAAADARVVEACKAEVQSRTFTRSNDNAPDRALATITYIWQ